MRVCLVSEEEEGWGGIGTYSAVLARGLCDLGHRVHLLLRGWEQNDREDVGRLTVHRVTVPEPTWHRATEPLLTRLYGAREALLWSRRVRGRVRAITASEGLDVIEMPEHRGAGAVYAIGGRAFGRDAGGSRGGWTAPTAAGEPTLVIRLHTPAFLAERGNAQVEDRLDRSAVELLERVALRRADLITAPSAAVVEAVAGRWRIPSERVAVLANPLDDDLFSPGEAPAASQVQADDRERRTILCVGRLELIKGVDVLVEALPLLRARHPDVHVRLVGDDDPRGQRGSSMGAHLAERARALGMPDGVLELVGAVDRAELPGLLRAADVCAVPSRWENLSYACIEAMSCARPVVASRVGGLSEVITDGVDGLLVTPGDPPALADAISRLLDDRALAARLGASARATVTCRYARSVASARIASAYEAAHERRHEQPQGMVS
jgi:glycosyltransferase involved in cell wall biosynthesis